MTSRLVITILTRGDEMEHHVPAGFQFADDVFDEAGLRDPISAGHSDRFSKQVRIIQRALVREFRGYIVLRVVNPWTLGGLWLTIRHRLRQFTCILIAGRPYPIDAPVSELVEAVRLVIQLPQQRES